jgi:hypothetical protein
MHLTSLQQSKLLKLRESFPPSERATNPRFELKLLTYGLLVPIDGIAREAAASQMSAVLELIQQIDLDSC